MSKFITLTGLSRFLHNLRKETEPFYVQATIGAEMYTDSYDCKFSDIVKAWEKGRPIYVLGHDILSDEYMIVGSHTGEQRDSCFYFFVGSELKALCDNGK